MRQAQRCWTSTSHYLLCCLHALLLLCLRLLLVLKRRSTLVCMRIQSLFHAAAPLRRLPTHLAFSLPTHLPLQNFVDVLSCCHNLHIPHITIFHSLNGEGDRDAPFESELNSLTEALDQHGLCLQVDPTSKLCIRLQLFRQGMNAGTCMSVTLLYVQHSRLVPLSYLAEGKHLLHSVRESCTQASLPQLVLLLGSAHSLLGFPWWLLARAELAFTSAELPREEFLHELSVYASSVQRHGT